MRKLALVVAALVLLPAVALAYDPPADGILFQADFDDLPDGTDMDGNNGYGGAALWGAPGTNEGLWRAISDPTGSGMGNVLAFSGYGHYFIDLPPDPWGDPYTLDADLTIYEFDIYYASQTAGEATHDINHNLGFYYQERSLGQSTDAWEVHTPAPIDDIGNADSYVNVWTHVQVVIDHDAATFDYIVNGITVVDDHVYGTHGRSGLGFIEWDTYYDNQGDYSLLMDNMSIVHIPEPGVLLLCGLGLLALLRRKK